MSETYTPKTTPFKHQAEEFAARATAPAWARFWEQGTGKSKSIIDEATALYEKGEIDAVIVVAPNGVERNWKTDELPAHLPDRHWSGTRVEFWQTGKAGTKKHAAAFKTLLHHEGFAWLLMSYDAVMTNTGKQFLWEFLKRRRVLYALDESSDIKSPGAKRTIRVVASGKYAKYRRIMDGTPVTAGPFDVYAPIKFLDENFWGRHRLGSYTVFKKVFGKWFTAKECLELHGYDPKYDKLLGFQNLDKLNKILSTVSSRVLKVDVMDLPPKLYGRRYFELTPEQVNIYNQLKNDFYAELENGSFIEAPLAIVRLLRYQQILSGYAYTDDEEEPFQLLPGKNPRLQLLGDIVEGQHHKSIIWARFTKDIDQIVELIKGRGGNVVRYDGQCSDEEAADNSEQFKRGDAQWIVANPSKGARGLTWNMAHHVVYYNNSFKLRDRLQSEDRAHRGVMTHSVDYTDIEGIMPDGKKTVDNHIVTNLRNKFDVAAEINGDKLREWI